MKTQYENEGSHTKLCFGEKNLKLTIFNEIRIK